MHSVFPLPNSSLFLCHCFSEETESHVWEYILNSQRISENLFPLLSLEICFLQKAAASWDSLSFSLFLSSVLTTQAHPLPPRVVYRALLSQPHCPFTQITRASWLLYPWAGLSQKTARVMGQQVHSGPLRAFVGVGGWGMKSQQHSENNAVRIPTPVS